MVTARGASQEAVTANMMETGRSTVWCGKAEADMEAGPQQGMEKKREAGKQSCCRLEGRLYAVLKGSDLSFMER